MARERYGNGYKGGHAPAHESPWPTPRNLGEDGRPCERAHGPRLGRRKGLEMRKRRKNQFREALDAKPEALARAALVSQLSPRSPRKEGHGVHR